jgi:hypothetical protein
MTDEIKINQNVNQSQEQQQDQVVTLPAEPAIVEPAEQEQTQEQTQEQHPAEEGAEDGKEDGQEQTQEQALKAEIPAGPDPQPADAPVDEPATPAEPEAPKVPEPFTISAELRAKFDARGEEGRALEALQKAFIDEMRDRVVASRDASRAIWEEVYAAAGLSQADFNGTLDPETGVVTFEATTKGDAPSGLGAILKKMLAA